MLAPLRGTQPMSTPEPDFREVHDALRPRVLRYLARMAGEAEAEDLAQEVFEKVSRSLGDFRGDAELSTWVYRIATNTALDRLRRRGSRRTWSIRYWRMQVSLPRATATCGPTRSGRRWKGA